MKQSLTILLLISLLALGCREESKPKTSPESPSSNQPSLTLEQADKGTETFSQRSERFNKELFAGRYKSKKMDPMDHFPQFKTAPQSMFRRYQMVKPISNASGKSIFPRVTAKGYRFPSEKVADEAVLGWLNGFDSSEDSISLGQEIKYVKSPPLFAAVWKNEFYIVQTACIYQHSTYDELRDAFNGFWEEEKAKYVLEIDCNGGHLHYN